jgi:hypothetical protein
MANPSSPGWHPHPTRKGKFGYWNGREWDNDVRDSMPESKPNRSTPSGRQAERAAAVERSASSKPVDLVNPIALGVSVAIVGGILLGLGLRDDGNAALVALGYMAAGVGTIVAQVGLIALAVSLGIRHARR